VRLLTLTGIGGVGKTRLALAVAADLYTSFREGVVVVSLATIRDPALVLPTIVETLGIECGSRSLWQTLPAFLREKQILLLLDNFEHLIGAAASMGTLLACCPDLKMLVTSREPLRVQGEYEVPVPPLTLPQSLPSLSVPQLLANPAVALFVERAQQRVPDFWPTEANAETIAQICIQLEGLPLSLELAAARLPLFSPSALLARLSERLQVLTGGCRDAPARQRSLRHALSWSYALLEPLEQTLFRQLSV
jgi:predicted ATPase